MLRPAHLIVLMQLSISRSHAEADQLQMPGAWRQSGTAALTARRRRRFLRSHCTACQPGVHSLGPGLKADTRVTIVSRRGGDEPSPWLL